MWAQALFPQDNLFPSFLPSVAPSHKESVLKQTNYPCWENYYFIQKSANKTKLLSCAGKCCVTKKALLLE